MRLAINSTFLLAACLFAGLPLASSALAQDEAPKEASKFVPGEEVKIDRDGFRGHILIYTPTDYKDDRTWPIIFCFHGHTGKPTTWPFKQSTGGKGFIIVGMDYKQKEYHDNFKYSLIDNEIRNMLEISRLVRKQLKVDTSMIFIGGFSQGGYTTTVVGEKLAGQVAGLLVLGAGRGGSGRPGRGLQRKPIYVGCGESDKDHIPRARKAAELYHSVGADVTFEAWQGFGHKVNVESEKMRKWLIGYGPMRKAKVMLAEAQKAEKAKKLGLSLELYRQAGEIVPEEELCQKAAEKAKEMTAAAEAAFAEVDTLLGDNEKQKALRKLLQLKRAYSGSDFGDKATEMLKKTKSG